MTMTDQTQVQGEGWKLLAPDGSTTYQGTPTYYLLPSGLEEWGPWMVHPEPGVADGCDCGPGGYHVMKTLSARYASKPWWPWKCQYRRALGESAEKVRAVEVRLQRYTARAWWKDLRTGSGVRADLREAHLWGADLRGANLREADLREAVGIPDWAKP